MTQQIQLASWFCGASWFCRVSWCINCALETSPTMCQFSNTSLYHSNLCFCMMHFTSFSRLNNILVCGDVVNIIYTWGSGQRGGGGIVCTLKQISAKMILQKPFNKNHDSCNTLGTYGWCHKMWFLGGANLEPGQSYRCWRRKSVPTVCKCLNTSLTLYIDREWERLKWRRPIAVESFSRTLRFYYVASTPGSLLPGPIF